MTPPAQDLHPEPALAGSVVSGRASGAPTARLSPYGDGISAIDTEYLRTDFDASHLVVSGAECAFVDVGTNHAVPLLLDALAQQGQPAEAVRWVVLTHIHLDHAGGAGALLAHLPKAQIAVHPRGRAHLVDPSKLIAASRAVYGDAYYARVYGQILPIAAERVIATEDGARLPLGTRALEVLHTPGHALHHQALRDTRTGGIFTGDTFGVSYREFDVAGRAFVLPTTSPTQFDPDQLHASIDRILALAPPAVYLTHYGQLRDVPRLGADLHAAIDQHVAIATRHAAASEAEACIAADLWGWLDAALDAHGVRADAAFRREILGGDITLNAQGLVAWLARRRV